jgi:hypothetical protein
MGLDMFSEHADALTPLSADQFPKHDAQLVSTAGCK